MLMVFDDDFMEKILKSKRSNLVDEARIVNLKIESHKEVKCKLYELQKKLDSLLKFTNRNFGWMAMPGKKKYYSRNIGEILNSLDKIIPEVQGNPLLFERGGIRSISHAWNLTEGDLRMVIIGEGLDSKKKPELKKIMEAITSVFKKILPLLIKDEQLEMELQRRHIIDLKIEKMLGFGDKKSA